MGALVSKSPAKLRSDDIDRQLHEDGKCFTHECKILLLGAPGSGKTNIIRHMMITHKNDFAPDGFSMFVSAVHRNVFDSACQLVAHMKRIGVECTETGNRLFAEKIHTHVLPTPVSDDTPILTPEIAQAIYRLWKDPIIPMVMDEHRSSLNLMDSAPYFFDEVLRIGAPGYLPNETDVLRARTEAVGIKETQFSLRGMSIKILDVSGQRSERKKWIHCFEGVTSILYCVALDQYRLVLLQENAQNRMNESLLLFGSVVNSRWFLHASIILFLNKTNAFHATLKEYPLENYFPDYTGGNDINKAAKFILQKFVQANKTLPVYVHLVQATDPGNLRLVLAAVKETILQNAMGPRNSGVL